MLLATGIFGLGFFIKLPTLLLVVEVLLTILALFVFGSIKYQIHKDAISYGALLVIVATFWHVVPSGSFKAAEFFSFQGLDKLIHLDTLLFIFGLTFFVAVIAQTRLLEAISLFLLHKNRGRVVPTVAGIMAVVGFASGILDGVSMIGLMIRILVMILFLAKVKDDSVLYAVMVSTIVTTVCGMWLAYGEPPNLIMKANLHPHLDNMFFLRYCLPVAVGSYFIVFFNVRKHLRGLKVTVAELPKIQTTHSQWVGVLAFVPFVALLIKHSSNHAWPLFLASFAGFFVAVLGIWQKPELCRAAFKEARHECEEYLFLIPLFFSITLLTKTGFFNHFSVLLQSGLEKTGIVAMAYLQFVGASFLSAALDNNVVADFASRALQGLEISILHLFSLAQIAGYATGGCWTHIGSAQSVVAYSFIRREVDKNFTPFQWIKMMTPLILEIFVLMSVVISIEAVFFH